MKSSTLWNGASLYPSVFIQIQQNIWFEVLNCVQEGQEGIISVLWASLLAKP